MARNKSKAEAQLKKTAHEMNYYLKHGYGLVLCKNAKCKKPPKPKPEKRKGKK